MEIGDQIIETHFNKDNEIKKLSLAKIEKITNKYIFLNNGKKLDKTTLQDVNPGRDTPLNYEIFSIEAWNKYIVLHNRKYKQLFLEDIKRNAFFIELKDDIKIEALKELIKELENG